MMLKVFSSKPTNREWNYTPTYSNTGTVYAARFGRKFTYEEAVDLCNYFRSEGLDTGIKVMGAGFKIIVRCPYGKSIEGAMREAGKPGLTYEIQIGKAREGKLKLTDERMKRLIELEGRESFPFIANLFTLNPANSDFMGSRNMLHLADFLEGKTSKYEGLIDNRWHDPMKKADVLVRNNRGNDINWALLRERYRVWSWQLLEG